MVAAAKVTSPIMNKAQLVRELNILTRHKELIWLPKCLFVRTFPAEHLAEIKGSMNAC